MIDLSPEIYKDLLDRMAKAHSVAVITGAGISSESGIPTFRGAEGLWNNYSPEELATPQAFSKDPVLVWQWYDWRRQLCAKANPNPAHDVVAKMDKYFPEFLLITQNVDGLHPRAGSARMVEVHGNIWKVRCTVCRNIFDHLDSPLKEIPVHCTECGKLARPHIVWFGESYESSILEQAVEFVTGSDILFVIGTSGMVSMPVYLTALAAGSGSFIIEVNPDESELSNHANVVIREKAGKALAEIWNKFN